MTESGCGRSKVSSEDIKFSPDSSVKKSPFLQEKQHGTPQTIKTHFQPEPKKTGPWKVCLYRKDNCGYNRYSALCIARQLRNFACCIGKQYEPVFFGAGPPHEPGHENSDHRGNNFYSTDFYCRRLWDELHQHARTGLEIWLCGCLAAYSICFRWDVVVFPKEKVVLKFFSNSSQASQFSLQSFCWNILSGYLERD